MTAHCGSNMLREAILPGGGWRCVTA